MEPSETPPASSSVVEKGTQSDDSATKQIPEKKGTALTELLTEIQEGNADPRNLLQYVRGSERRGEQAETKTEGSISESG